MGEIVLEQADLAEYRIVPMSQLEASDAPAYVRTRIEQINDERIEEEGEEEAIGWCLFAQHEVKDLVTLTVYADELTDGEEEHMLLPGALLWMRQNEFDTSFVPVKGYPDPAWPVGEGAAPEVWVLSLVGFSEEALATLVSTSEDVGEDVYRGLLVCRYLLREQSFPNQNQQS